MKRKPQKSEIVLDGLLHPIIYRDALAWTEAKLGRAVRVEEIGKKDRVRIAVMWNEFEKIEKFMPL